MIRVKAAPVVKRSDIFILQVSFGFGRFCNYCCWTGNQIVMYAIIRRPLVLPTVIVGVVVIAGVLAMILLVGQTKGEHFVVSDSRWDISVARSPIEGAVH